MHAWIRRLLPAVWVGLMGALASGGVQASPSVAYVLVGEAKPSRAVETLARKAAHRYREAGYDARVIFGVSKAQLQGAINDPCIGALWYEGHGMQEDGKWIPAITVVDPATKTEEELGVNELTVPADSMIREVVLHSCGQKLDAWQEKFPKAVLRGWSSYALTPAMLTWETYFHQPVAPEHPAEDGWNRIDPRIRPDGPPITEFANGHRASPADLFTTWRLDGNPLAAYGNERRFNLYLTGGGFAEPQWLFGGAVKSGRLNADDYDAPLADADYSITLPYQRLRDVYENRDLWPGLLRDGTAQVSVAAADLDAMTAYNGTGALLFGLPGGVPAAPEPCSLTISVIGCLGLCGRGWRRRRQ